MNESIFSDEPYLSIPMKRLFSIVQNGRGTLVDTNFYTGEAQQEKINEFVKLMLRTDEWGIKKLQSGWMGVFMASLNKENQMIKTLENPLKKQITYFYLKIKEQFIGAYSELYQSSNLQDYDSQFVLQAFQLYTKLHQDEYYKKENNYLQENNSDHIFYPSYVTLILQMLRWFTSRGNQRQRFILEVEELRDFLEDDLMFEEALSFIEKYSSHIKILSYPKQSKGHPIEVEKIFWIPPVFKNFIQEKKDQLWMSSNMKNAESLLISIWEKGPEIGKELHEIEAINKIFLIGFMSENESKLRRLIEHIILVINFCVLFAQGYKEDGHVQLGTIPNIPTLMILFLLGSLLIIFGGMVLFISFVIKFKTSKQEISKGVVVVKMSFIKNLIFKAQVLMSAIYNELALLIGIICAILAYVDTTLYGGCFVFLIVRQKSMMNVIKAVWMAK